MKIDRPQVLSPDLESREAKKFLKGDTFKTVATVKQSPTAEPQPSRKARVTSTNPKGATPRTTKKALNIPQPRVIDERAICKFMLELPLPLRRKIKQASIDTGISMNGLIVSLLDQAYA